jgi:hypothetical protein
MAKERSDAATWECNSAERLAALAAGEKRYLSSRPCPRFGHRWRFTSESRCAECSDIGNARTNRERRA